MATAPELQAFRDAILVRRVVARVVQAEAVEAFEFPTPKALKDYFHKHPNADKSKHTVKSPEAQGGAKKLHEQHGNAGVQTSQHAADMQGKAHAIAEAKGDKEAVQKAVAGMKETHSKIQSAAETVLKDISAYSKQHGKGTGESQIHDLVHGLNRAISTSKDTMDSLAKQAESGHPSAPAAREAGLAASTLAAQVSNAVKELKRLGSD